MSNISTENMIIQSFSDIEERARTLARYMIQTGCTVRAAATHFGISKSTVHKDLTCILPKTSRSLYKQVKKVLDNNKAERHMRGGEATKQKYLDQKQTVNGKVLKNR